MGGTATGSHQQHYAGSQRISGPGLWHQACQTKPRPDESPKRYRLPVAESALLP